MRGHNGREKGTFCNGDYQRSSEAAESLAVGVLYFPCGECITGGNADFGIRVTREWAAAYMSAAHHIIERRWMEWQGKKN